MTFSVWFSAGGDVVDIAASDKRGRAARVPNVIRERAARIYPEVVARAA
jgi:hypothetical protein